jgi:transcriptional regulator with XRE-family HTH domain
VRTHTSLRAIVVSYMSAAVPDLLVLAEPPVKTAAVRFARRLGANPRAVEFGGWKPSPEDRRFLVYLAGGETAEDLKGVLRSASKSRYEVLVLYSAARAPEPAAKWGKVLGEMHPKRAHLCFEAGEVANILNLKGATRPEIDVAAMRKQLGLTQAQLAAALKLSPRTVQNWESGMGLSRLEKRAADVAEFVDLLNDFIRPEQQHEWLRTVNYAFCGQTPLELLLAGRVRDIIVRFRRLQAGKPM